MFEKLLNFIFPKKCFSCGHDGVSICNNCLNNFSKSVDTPFLYIYSKFSYKDRSVRKIIHSIKYFRRKDLINPLIEYSSNQLEKILKDVDYLVPIPMYKTKLYIRGYNQAEEISEVISKKFSIPIIRILLKNKKTINQVKTKNRSERLKNPIGSISIKTNTYNIVGKKILLVDDVITTGATINEARKVLIKSGGREVIAWTIAH